MQKRTRGAWLRQNPPIDALRHLMTLLAVLALCGGVSVAVARARVPGQAGLPDGNQAPLNPPRTGRARPATPYLSTQRSIRGSPSSTAMPPVSGATQVAVSPSDPTPVPTPTLTPEEEGILAQANALLDEGNALILDGHTKEATEKYEAALALYQRIDHKMGQAATLLNLGAAYLNLGEPQQALVYYEQALPLLQGEGGDRANWANALKTVGMLHYGLSNYVDALSYLQAALPVFQELEDLENQAQVLNMIGAIYYHLSDCAKALQYHERALAICHEMESSACQEATLANMGAACSNLGRYQLALEYLEQALAIGEETGARLTEAHTRISIGQVYYSWGDYQQALAYNQQALAIGRDINNLEITAKALNNIGEVYLTIGELQLALDYLKQALPMTQQILDRKGEAIVLSNVGSAYRGRGDYRQALAHYELALSISQEIGDRQAEARTLLNIGSVYDDLQDYDEALRHLQQALDIQQIIGDREGEATTLQDIGGLRAALYDLEQALVYYQQALTVWQEIGHRPGEAVALSNIGTIHYLQGDEAGALEFYLQSIAIREAIRGSAKVETLKAALASRDVDVYQRAIRLLIEMERPEEAFHLAERSRARAFLDGLGNSQLDFRKAADADLLQQEQILRGELTALESALRAEKSKLPDQQNALVVQSIGTQLEARQQEYEHLLAQLQLSHPELTALVTIDAATVADTQPLLDDQTTVVVYYLTDESVLAFVLTHDDFQVVELPATPQEIVDAVVDFHSLGMANLSNPYPRSLGDLYKWLVEPLLPHLTTPQVSIIPHQALHYVPFAALHDGERYLGEQFTLSHLPSASALPFIQDKTGREPTAPLILGDPATDNPDLARLNYAAQEAEGVGELFGVDVLLGEEASEEVLREKVGEAGVVHLAAHGSFNPAAPLFSRLWLAPGGDEDGHLNVHEVYGLDLDRADLVVLSACETQVGELSEGDEVVGLNRAFLYGAPTVMASLWSVDDEATGTLMVRFYTHLQEGMGKAEALQAAQADVRSDAEHPEWAHPYYWAPFVLSGDAGAVSDVMVVTTPTPAPTPTSSAESGEPPSCLFGAALPLVLAFVVLASRRSKVESGECPIRRGRSRG